MTDYQKYINALRKCAKEHENDSTLTGHIVVSDLCHDTANLLESLEQEPCDDCISRQAVIDSIRNYFHDEYYQRTSIQDCRDCLIEDVIKPLPSDTPQTKTGHLMFVKTIFDRHGCTAECSSCHKKWKTYDEIRFKEEHNFCPNCGTKFEVKE